jgi:hypothetical protein
MKEEMFSVETMKEEMFSVETMKEEMFPLSNPCFRCNPSRKLEMVQRWKQWMMKHVPS